MEEKRVLTMVGTRKVLVKDFNFYGTWEQPMFLAKDVAERIEHSNVRMMLQPVDDDEKVVRIAYTLGGNQKQWFLTEQGLYEVCMLSRKPIAKEMKREIKSILKEVRLNGGSVETGREEDFINAYFPSFSDETKLKMVDDLRKQNTELKERLHRDKPYTTYGKAIESSDDAIMIGAYAKLLRNAGISFGRNTLFEWLRDNGYLLKQTNEKNNPKERYLKQGIFVIQQETTETNGSTKITQTTKLTGKGQLYLLEKIIEDFSMDILHISNELHSFIKEYFISNGLKTEVETKLMLLSPNKYHEDWTEIREMLFKLDYDEKLILEVDEILEN